MNFRLINPVFSSWPLNGLPCFSLNCNYLLGILVFFGELAVRQLWKLWIMGSDCYCIPAHPFHNLLVSVASHVLSAIYISFHRNYVQRSLVKLKKEGRGMTQVFSTGPLVGCCLIMLTICPENGVRSPEQTRLIHFAGLSAQPNYCITNSDSFTPWRSTLISACNTGAGVRHGKSMLTSSLYHSQTAGISHQRSRHLVLHISEISKWRCLDNYRQCYMILWLLGKNRHTI